MAEQAKAPKKIQVPEGGTGFVVLEFTQNHGSYKKGDKETYHHSTANALVGKLNVAKVSSYVKKVKPKKEKK